MLIVNAYLMEGKVSLDGQEFTSTVRLIEYLNKKFAGSYPMKDYNVSRHKPHVAGFNQGMAMILRGNKLFRPSPDGDLQEIRQFEPEVALRIIISIGLDELLSRRMRLGAKTLVDALKIYSDITQNKGENDDYDKIVAAKHKGAVIDATPKTPQELLDQVPFSDFPEGIEPPNFEEDEEDA